MSSYEVDEVEGPGPGPRRRAQGVHRCARCGWREGTEGTPGVHRTPSPPRSQSLRPEAWPVAWPEAWPVAWRVARRGPLGPPRLCADAADAVDAAHAAHALGLHGPHGATTRGAPSAPAPPYRPRPPRLRWLRGLRWQGVARGSGSRAEAEAGAAELAKLAAVAEAGRGPGRRWWRARRRGTAAFCACRSRRGVLMPLLVRPRHYRKRRASQSPPLLPPGPLDGRCRCR